MKLERRHARELRTIAAFVVADASACLDSEQMNAKLTEIAALIDEAVRVDEGPPPYQHPTEHPFPGLRLTAYEKRIGELSFRWEFAP